MEQPKFDHAIEGAAHAGFAACLYATGEYLAEHHNILISLGLPTVGLTVIVIFRRPVIRLAKSTAKKFRRPKVYHLRDHS